MGDPAKTKVQVFVWDEHEEPQELHGSSLETVFEVVLAGWLKVKEYGKVRRVYPTGELAIYYRAFTDEHRGRQIVSGVSLAELDAAYQERKKQCTLKVFTPAELYALKPVRIDYDPWLTVSVHLSEDVSHFDLDFDAVEKTQRVEIRTLADHDYDGRRVWTLQTVWFDNKPVMVVNSSGRDGDEYHERWITDAQLFGELVTFLRTFTPQRDVDGFVKADAKIPGMTEFYNHTIHDYYDVEAQRPKKP
jgi:hypothetical protein